jgi:asparagine synthase (glutamine-hydrolysing)
MCGICGILQIDAGASAVLISNMTNCLRHRGPDDGGIHISGPVALGHRRLSIIDIDGGAQPMSNEDGHVWVTFNGEIYNYRELRKMLQTAGHKFRSNSDTEVIVHAWEEWGERCVDRFRGMFAFAIADYTEKKLFLARDHLGIKPLYYFRTKEVFAFASELQALRLLPQCPDEIDIEAIGDFFSVWYVPAPRTVYKNIFKLPPGSRMTVAFDGTMSGTVRYWELLFKPELGIGVEEWTDRLEAVLRESVRAHLVSDVPFGAFLSGGLDSTAVVAFMSESLTKPVKTFSIGWDDAELSELKFARQVAERFGTDHYEEVVRTDAISLLPDLVRHYGEPFGDSSVIPTFCVSRLARQHVPMVLTGDGGDEALLGYDRYVTWRAWINPERPRRPLWKRMLRPPLQALLPERFPADVKSRPTRVWDWLRFWESGDQDTRRRLWRDGLLSAVDRPIQEFENIAETSRQFAPEQFGQYLDYGTYLADDILTKIDIAGMRYGLEARTPFADVKVAEFAAAIPWQMNLQQRAGVGWTGKQLLKRILSEYFDSDFLDRRKSGFGVPLQRWLKAGGNLRREVEERFLGSKAKIHCFFRADVIEELVSGKRKDCDYSQLLWQLLFLENWLEQVHTTIRIPIQAPQFAT